MTWGRSLSFCIKDILEGNVSIDEVGGIVASTLMKNEDDLRLVFASYMQTYWIDYSKMSLFVWDILKGLWDAGKIYQPRLNKRVCQNLHDYPIWADTFEDAYKSLEPL